MSAWKKTMLYLGLGPDDAYDQPPVERESEGSAAPASGSATVRPAGPASGVSRTGDVRPLDTGGTVRPIRAVPDPSEGTTVRPLPNAGTGTPTVRPVASVAAAKPHAVSPTSFNEAQQIADRFKASQPVIVNLQGVDRDLSRRLIDFASGLCYGLGGQMERVANQVYLLTPTNVEVSAEERQRITERGAAAT